VATVSLKNRRRTRLEEGDLDPDAEISQKMISEYESTYEGPRGKALPTATEYYRQFIVLSVDQKIYHTTAVIVSLTIIGCVLVYLKFILVPLTLAFFLTYFLAPMVDLLMMRPWNGCTCISAYYNASPEASRTRSWIKRLKPAFDFLMMFKFPKWLAVIMSFFMAFMIMFLIGAVIVYSIDEFVDHSEKYVNRINELSFSIFALGSRLGIGTAQHKEKFLEYVAQLPLGSIVTELMHSFCKLITNTMLVMIIVVYLLLGRTDHDRGTIRREIDQQIRHYIVLKVLISASFGLLVCIILLALKVDLAVVFGLMCFILNFVPTVGSVIAILLPLPILLLDSDKSWVVSILAVSLPAALSFVFGWIIEPSFFGSSMQLHEISVLVALVFWSALWGIAGAVLSVPILVVAKICLEKVDHPIAQYMLKCITGFDNYRQIYEPHLSSGSKAAYTTQPNTMPTEVGSVLAHYTYPMSVVPEESTRSLSTTEKMTALSVLPGFHYEHPHPSSPVFASSPLFTAARVSPQEGGPSYAAHSFS
jgi:AI-2 transport protein TqsA